MYLNRVTLYGNLTRDPEVKALPSGIKVASFSLATNRTWKDPSGAKKEQVEYHNLVAFGKQAEVITQYVKKGGALYIEGRLQTRSWDGADGAKKYRTEIVIEQFQFGPRSTPGMTQGAAPASKDEGLDDLDTIEYPEGDINLEDIPF